MVKESGGPSDEVLAERERVLAIIESHRKGLERAGLYPRLWNLINSGRTIKEIYEDSGGFGFQDPD